MIEPFPLRWPAGWPRTANPRRSTFRVVSFARARDGMLAEVKRLGGVRTVITSDLPTRLDGLPYGNASDPPDPGIAVWWVKAGREQVIACDRWTRTRDNLHAIELSLAALRGLGRWGTSEIVARAFAGFAALPPAPSDWRRVLGLELEIAYTLAEVKDRYRELARQHHPDLGGNSTAMQDLVAAYQSAEAELG